MTREQQIEEMANLMADTMLKNFGLRYKDFAQTLYEAGYQKIDGDEICSIDYHNEQMWLARKEVVKEFAEKLKERFKGVVFKDYGGKIVAGPATVTLASALGQINNLLKEYEQ